MGHLFIDHCMLSQLDRDAYKTTYEIRAPLYKGKEVAWPNVSTHESFRVKIPLKNKLP